MGEILLSFRCQYQMPSAPSGFPSLYCCFWVTHTWPKSYRDPKEPWGHWASGTLCCPHLLYFCLFSCLITDQLTVDTELYQLIFKQSLTFLSCSRILNFLALRIWGAGAWVIDSTVDRALSLYYSQPRFDSQHPTWFLESARSDPWKLPGVAFPRSHNKILMCEQLGSKDWLLIPKRKRKKIRFIEWRLWSIADSHSSWK